MRISAGEPSPRTGERRDPYWTTSKYRPSGHALTLTSALALARVKHGRGDDAGAVALLDWLDETATPARPATDSVLAQAHRLRDAMGRSLAPGGER